MLRFKWETPISERTIKKIPDGWERKNLGHVAELHREHFLPKDEDTRLYVGLEHIEEGTLTLKGVGKSKEVVSSKSVFLKGDILFGKLRPYFRKVILAPFDGVCSTDILVIKPKTKTHNKYLFYLLASRQIIDSVSTASEGTKMPRTSWGFLESIEINVPPYEEQKRIGEVLSWFDDLIENKKRQNEILEKTAMAVFKSWFVDFEPFSDSEFVDSALGKMPKNGEIGKLSDVCEIIMGQSPPSEYYNREGEGSPFIQGKGQFGRFIPNTDVFCSTTGKKAKPKDILLTVRAPIGELNIADTDYIIGRGLASLRSENWVFIHFYLLSNKELLKASERGTTFDAITKPELESFPIIIPPQNVLEKFKALVEPLSRKIILNEKQISVLTKVRDALLPLLVFGKLRVEEI